VGWFLILVPTLTAAGVLVGLGPVTGFHLAVTVLFVTASWDWWRFQDRSRTLHVTMGLFGAFAVAGVVAYAWSRPPLGPAVRELVAVVVLFALALAFVQLYRTAETVLTVARGWLYALVGMIGVAVWEILTGRHLPNYHLPASAQGSDPGWALVAGPFGDPNQFAAALCLAVMVMPIGGALEHDRRLRRAYPVAVLPVPWVVWHTGSTLGMVACLAALGLWAVLHRRARITVLPLGALLLLVLPQGRMFLTTLWTEVVGIVTTDPEVAGGIRFNLMRDGVVMLRRTLWLGVGPGGFPSVMETRTLPYPTSGIVTPYSAVVEITAQYGLSIFVALTLAVLGVARWCVQRLVATRGTPYLGPDRIAATWLLVTLVLWPGMSTMNPTWLAQPLSALQVATMVMLARHIERPRGRLVMPSEAALRHIPPGPAVR
jgi:teichuronic acid biosynthesis protein TuaE